MRVLRYVPGDSWRTELLEQSRLAVKKSIVGSDAHLQTIMEVKTCLIESSFVVY